MEEKGLKMLGEPELTSEQLSRRRVVNAAVNSTKQVLVVRS